MSSAAPILPAAALGGPPPSASPAMSSCARGFARRGAAHGWRQPRTNQAYERSIERQHQREGEPQPVRGIEASEMRVASTMMPIPHCAAKLPANISRFIRGIGPGRSDPWSGPS